MSVKRTAHAIRTMLGEWRKALALCDDFYSRYRLCTDFLLGRIIALLPARMLNKKRQIRIKPGAKLYYRLNRGDLQGIREVWLDSAYRLPFPAPGGVLLDLGANIGLASVWLHCHYSFSSQIAVEPDPANIAILRENFACNGIEAEILQAAIGPEEGEALFSFSEWSNLGHISTSGTRVQVVSVPAIMERFHLSEIDLMKIDIEGAEQDLFLRQAQWLRKVRGIIIEFHPNSVDYPLLTRTVESYGLKYLPANTVFKNNMDSFCRAELLSPIA
jgi:FkbM family methyltransferase